MAATLAELTGLMQAHGANRLFAKLLPENDNSKNQIYLGGDFTALNIIPHGPVYVDREVRARSKQDRPKADVDFYWVDENGPSLAPSANLILYPDYPEVRLSGLLLGCRGAPSKLINARLKGRVIFFGVTPDRRVLGYIVPDGHSLGNEVKAGRWDQLGVFLELPLAGGRDPKSLLLAELKRIHETGWIDSIRLQADGTKRQYSARNGGGYTLEAQLGITPNGYSEPDFHGWEVKQYAVGNFTTYAPKFPVTLMTPEPTGGLYKSRGLDEFMRRFGYPDKSGRPDRINFGGVYKCDGDFHPDTGLRILVQGFDVFSGKITDLQGGGISLCNEAGIEAATWSIAGLMDHWNRKHAQAAYVPSMSRSEPAGYRYGGQVHLCEGTDFILFLKAFVGGHVYYDPACKLVGASPPFVMHRRSQFRVRHRHLADLYHRSEPVDLTKI